MGVNRAEGGFMAEQHVASVRDAVVAAIGAEHLSVGDAISEDYSHDEALTVAGVRPRLVARPASTAEVAALVEIAEEHRVPITARGSGTGLSGACTPTAESLVISFERMNAILEIDTENHVAVVQPGVTLAQLDEWFFQKPIVRAPPPGGGVLSTVNVVVVSATAMKSVQMRSFTSAIVSWNWFDSKPKTWSTWAISV